MLTQGEEFRIAFDVVQLYGIILYGFISFVLLLHGINII